MTSGVAVRPSAAGAQRIGLAMSASHSDCRNQSDDGQHGYRQHRHPGLPLTSRWRGQRPLPTGPEAFFRSGPREAGGITCGFSPSMVARDHGRGLPGRDVSERAVFP